MPRFRTAVSYPCLIIVDLPHSMDEAPPDLVDNDFSFGHFPENEDYRENFSVDLPPMNDLDPPHTPQKNLSFVEGHAELEFTPTPKKYVDASSIIFPSPIRHAVNGEQYSDILENDENVNPRALLNQNKFQDGSSDGMNHSTKIAISILKEELKDIKDSISFDEISSKVIWCLNFRWEKRIQSECFLRHLC
jgi:hypothetical protein